LLGGLWEPVRAPLGADTDPAVALGQAFEAVGLIAVPRRPLGEVSHTFSHRQLTLTVWSVHLQGTPQPGGPYDRVQAVDPESVGLSKLARKALELDRAPPLFLAAET
jgi:adenine-specific DNA glycosylase